MLDDIVSHGEWIELPFLLLLWGLSGPRIAELRKMPHSFSNKLHSETQISGRLGMSGVDPLVMPRTPYRASDIYTLATYTDYVVVVL